MEQSGPLPNGAPASDFATPSDSAFVARSVHHPGGRPRSYVFSSRLVRPLGTMMLPVMIGALLSMLEGYPVLRYLYIGFPLSVLLSFIWTGIMVQREIVEIHVLPDAVAVRSLTNASRPPRPLKWYRLLDVKSTHSKLRMTVGYDLYLISRKDWPEIDPLEEKLRAVLNPS